MSKAKIAVRTHHKGTGKWPKGPVEPQFFARDPQVPNLHGGIVPVVSLQHHAPIVTFFFFKRGVLGPYLEHTENTTFGESEVMFQI